MENSIPVPLGNLLEELSALEDRELLAELLIEFAEKFVPVPEHVAKPPYPKKCIVPGCESQAYVWAVKDQCGNPKFYFAIENPQGISAKALAVILDETLSGQPPKAIRSVPEEIVLKIFGENLTMGRGQGLMSMVAMVKALAGEC